MIYYFVSLFLSVFWSVWIAICRLIMDIISHSVASSVHLSPLTIAAWKPIYSKLMLVSQSVPCSCLSSLSLFLLHSGTHTCFFVLPPDQSHTQSCSFSFSYGQSHMLSALSCMVTSSSCAVVHSPSPTCGHVLPLTFVVFPFNQPCAWLHLLSCFPSLPHTQSRSFSLSRLWSPSLSCGCVWPLSCVIFLSCLLTLMIVLALPLHVRLCSHELIFACFLSLS